MKRKSKSGDQNLVIGGAQDNGTQYKDNSKPWSKEFAEERKKENYLTLIIKRN